MVTPDMYDSLLRPPAPPARLEQGVTQDVVDRLEAAVDEALLADAKFEARTGNPRRIVTVVQILLRSLNDRLSQDLQWKKRGIAYIFHEHLAARYVASGWARAWADYDSDQSKWVKFYFGTEATSQSIDGVSARDMRGMIREVAEVLGAGMTSTEFAIAAPAAAPGWLRAAMDDLRVAAKYRMLDLEAAGREAER